MDVKQIRHVVSLGLAKSCQLSTLVDCASTFDFGLGWTTVCDALGACTLADLLELKENDVRASSLKPVQQRKVINFLKELRPRGRAKLIAAHALPEARDGNPSPDHGCVVDLVSTNSNSHCWDGPSENFQAYQERPRKTAKVARERKKDHEGSENLEAYQERPRKTTKVARESKKDHEGSENFEAYQEGPDAYQERPRKVARISLLPRSVVHIENHKPISMHVAFVLDTSRSMERSDVDGADSRMDAVFQSVSQFLQGQVDTSAKACAAEGEVVAYSLILFSCANKTNIAFQCLPARGAQAKLHSVWKSVAPRGPTLYAQGLKALSLVVDAIERREARPQHPLEHIALFLSDGKPGDSLRDVERHVRKLCDEVAGRLHLHTVGFGSETQAGSLQRIAELGGGEFLDNVGVPLHIANATHDNSTHGDVDADPSRTIESHNVEVDHVKSSNLQAASLSHALATVLHSSMASVRHSAVVAPTLVSRPLQSKIASLQQKLLFPSTSSGCKSEAHAEETFSAVRMMENGGRFAVSGQGSVLLFAENFEDVLRTIKDVPLRTVRLSKRPFATGGMRSAHRMWDTPPPRKDGGQNESLALVAKQTFEAIASTRKQCAIDEMLATNRAFLEMHSAAATCARAFNKALNLERKVSFVDAYVYLLLDEQRCIQKCYNVEPYLEGSYCKFNTNAGKVLTFTENARGPQALPFEIGHLVERRDLGKPWGKGYVTQLDPLKVTAEANPAALSASWDEVRHVHVSSNYPSAAPCEDATNDANLLAQAFSHFSHQDSGGDYIIVDIQGVGLQWTDPQLHSRDRCFGKGDFGNEGFQRFFATHFCNGYCRKLKLERPLLGRVPVLPAPPPSPTAHSEATPPFPFPAG